MQNSSADVMLASQRALFDIPSDVCYLNAASYTPLPLATLAAGRAAVGRKGRPWLVDNDFATQQYGRTRQAAAQLIRADAADVALIPSISYGVASRYRPARGSLSCMTIIPHRCWNG
jgi:selenocysteine lyase/cysteine desulfurase